MSGIGKILTRDILEKEYKELQSCRKIGEKYNISYETVRLYIHKYCLDYNEPKKFSWDDDFFTRDNEASFYVAGFFAADGCIKERKGIANTFSLTLGAKDKDHLIRIRDLMGANNNIHYTLDQVSYRNTTWKDSEKYGFEITSEKLCSDAKRFNIVPRKTHIYTFPEWMINHPFVNHFMRGYVDGDGSYWFAGQNSTRVNFSVLGTKQFVETFKSILERECGIPIYDNQIRPRPGTFELAYSGNPIVSKICKFLYRDAEIYLTRKYDRAKTAETKLTIRRDKLENIKLRKDEESCEKFRRYSYLWMNHTHIGIGEREKLVNLYSKERYVGGVAKELGIRLSTASNLLKSNGIKINSNKLIITKEKLQELYDKFGQINLVAKELKCNTHTIVKYLKEFNIQFSNRHANKQDHSYFSLNNECAEQYYWAGYLLGTSVIFDNSIRITRSDKNELERFVAAGISTSPICGKNNSYNLSFASKQIVLDLSERFGITKDKNTKYIIPDNIISSKYFVDFINGRIDAKSTISLKNRQLELNGPEDFLKQLRQIFIEKCDISNLIEVRYRKSASRLMYTNSSFDKIVNYLKYKKL